MSTARPTTSLIGTEPCLPVPPGSLNRESREMSRWSPITQILPAGTVMLKSFSLGAFPG